MGDKEKLSDMLDAFINNKQEESRIAFHDYLGKRIKAKFHDETPNAPEHEEENQ
jgi:hypothetical protein